MWSNIKAVVEEHLSSENVYACILLVDDLMVKQLCTYRPTINKETSLNIPTTKQKLFKK